MARPRYPKHTGPPPPPLSPAARTVGQLVAESLRLYGARFWAALAIGVPAAAVNLTATELSRGAALVFVPTVGALLLTAAYVGAASIAYGVPLRSRAAGDAYLAGVIVFVPFPFFASLFILPGLVWLAFVGLAVPAALVERVGVRTALRRGIELARADFAHVLGGLATLTLTVFFTQALVFFLLRQFADDTQRVAASIAYVFMAPVLFLGAAFLYGDQAARVGTTRQQRLERRRAEIGGRAPGS